MPFGQLPPDGTRVCTRIFLIGAGSGGLRKKNAVRKKKIPERKGRTPAKSGRRKFRGKRAPRSGNLHSPEYARGFFCPAGRTPAQSGIRPRRGFSRIRGTAAARRRRQRAGRRDSRKCGRYGCLFPEKLRNGFAVPVPGSRRKPDKRPDRRVFRFSGFFSRSAGGRRKKTAGTRKRTMPTQSQPARR